MEIIFHGDFDIKMSQNFAQRLNIAPALQAGGSKGMPQGVRMHTAHPGPAKIPPDALAVAARLDGLFRAAGEKPCLRAYVATQLAQQGKELLRDRYLSAGASCFCRLYDYFCVSVPAVDAAHSAANGQRARRQIEIAPLQTTDLADTQSQLHLQ